MVNYIQKVCTNFKDDKFDPKEKNLITHIRVIGESLEIVTEANGRIFLIVCKCIEMFIHEYNIICT